MAKGLIKNILEKNAVDIRIKCVSWSVEAAMMELVGGEEEERERERREREGEGG